MTSEVRSAKDCKVSRWSGGVTRELYILPEDGDYGERRFSVRISSASVSLDESDFTSLPGVTRYITPVEGGFTLTHPDEKPLSMKPFDRPYRFDGGIATHCEGRASDFNLMLKDGAQGSMEVYEGEAPVRAGVNVYYPEEGGVLSALTGDHALEKGDILIIKAENGEEGVIKCGRVICCHILP